MMLYSCEQTIPGKPELQIMLNCFDFCLENKKVTTSDVFNGIIASTHIMDMMDAPKRYEIARTIINHLIEKKYISEDAIKKKLNEVQSGLNLS